MFIKAREELQQPLNPKGFWVSVLLATTIIGFVCIPMTQMGKALHLWHRAEWLFLLAVWAPTVCQFIQHGWRAVPWPQNLSLVAFTLWLAVDLLPHSLRSLVWVQGIGVAAFLAFTLPQFLQFDRGRSKPASSRPDTTV